VAVARVVIAVPPPFEFPVGLRLLGEATDGSRIEIPFDETSALDRLFRLLLHCPREAALILDLPHSVLTELTPRVRESDPFGMPWTMSEVRVFTSRERDAAGPLSRSRDGASIRN
jgi:hypothetical protein